MTGAMRPLEAVFRDHGGLKSRQYLEIYEALFGSLRLQPVALLELGIYKGGSLAAWAEYFPHGRIAGLDREPPSGPSEIDRVRMYAADQADTAALSRVAREAAPDGFDIIVDDCSHIGRLSKASFWHLFENHLKPGGLYCIEDWTTGYWPWWPDGRSLAAEPDTERRMPSHDAGMVGFVKQLIDEFRPGVEHHTPQQLYAALLWMEGGAIGVGESSSRFASVTVYPGICAVTKAQR